MATINITEKANELLTRAIALAGQGKESSAIAAAVGVVERETYLALRTAWKTAYAVKATEIRQLKRDRQAPAPLVDASLPEKELEEAKELRKRALADKDAAQQERVRRRGDARELMEVRAALKQMARAHAATARNAA